MQVITGVPDKVYNDGVNNEVYASENLHNFDTENNNNNNSENNLNESDYLVTDVDHNEDVVKQPRRSTRKKVPIKHLEPSFKGKTYGETIMIQDESTQPDNIDNSKFKRHVCNVITACLGQISLKHGL